MTKVKIIVCKINTKKIGYIPRSWMRPRIIVKRECPKRYDQGLNKIKSTRVVYNVNRHLSLDVGGVMEISIIYWQTFCV